MTASMCKKRLALILLALVVLSATITPTPLVKAAPADSTPIFTRWTGYYNSFTGTSTPSGQDCDDVQTGSALTLPKATAIYLNKTEAYMHIQTYNRLTEQALYVRTGAGDAGAKIGESDQIYQPDSGSYQWKVLTWADKPDLTPYQDQTIFIAVWCEAKSLYGYVGLSGNAGDSWTHADGFDGVWPNPMTGEGGLNAESKQRALLTVLNETQTTYNTKTEDTTRRDLNITWPSGATGKEIRIVYHKSEKLLNVTASNGGLWNQTVSGYDTGTYNASHNVITLDNTDLDTYGGDLRLFTEDYTYIFTLQGPYYEDGTNYPSPVLVTAHTVAGSDSFNVTGGDSIWASDTEPLMFNWGIGDGNSRLVYVINSETILVTMPEDECAAYGFTIRDYTGRVSPGTSYLESLRFINGTYHLIERMFIQDTANTVPLTLVLSRIYVLRVRFMDDSLYTFGAFVPGVETTPTLSIYGLDSSEQLHYIGEEVTVTFQRPTYGQIKINYTDTAQNTTSIFVEVCNLNGAQIWNDTYASHSHMFTWSEGEAIPDYLVNLVAQHPDYGEVYASCWLAGLKPQFEEPPDFDAMLGEGASTGFAVFLILAAYLLFSRATALLGIFFATMMTYIMIYLGFLDMSYLPVHVTMGLVVMWGLGGGGSR